MRKADLPEKILYQLIIARLDGDKIKIKKYRNYIIELVEKGIGGFIIFGGVKDEIKPFISKLQSFSEIPLFIASDIERGVGQQVKDMTDFPCQMAIASAIARKSRHNLSLLKDAIKAITMEAVYVGINMPLIPVLDVNQHPDNPIICTRAFSDDPKTVAWFGVHYVKTLENSGLISCPKHFPGHGDTAVDSHIALPVINKSRDDLIKIDLQPFIKSIEASSSSIMIGHLKVPSIDSKPASLSKKIITDLLRRELGFKGLVLTDALNMSAIKDYGKISVRCINAGVDILLHPSDVDLTVQELKDAMKFNEVNKKRIDNALERILKTKEGLKDIRKYEFNPEKNLSISKRLYDLSIALVRGDEDMLKLYKGNNFQMIFAGDSKIYSSCLLKRYFRNSELKDNGLAIVCIFTSVSAWKGDSGIDKNEIEKIQKIIKKAKKTIIVSFGSPYVLSHFKDADMLIAAYESSEHSQEAFIKCLKGEIQFNGKLPVRLN